MRPISEELAYLISEVERIGGIVGIDSMVRGALIETLEYQIKLFSRIQAQMYMESHHKSLYTFPSNVTINVFEEDLKEEIKSINNITNKLVKVNTPVDHFIWQCFYCQQCHDSILAEYLQDTAKYKLEMGKALNTINRLLGVDHKVNLPTEENLATIINKKGDVIESYLPIGGTMTNSLRQYIYTQMYLPIFPQWNRLEWSDQVEFLKTYKLRDILKEIV